MSASPRGRQRPPRDETRPAARAAAPTQSPTYSPALSSLLADHDEGAVTPASTRPSCRSQTRSPTRSDRQRVPHRDPSTARPTGFTRPPWFMALLLGLREEARERAEAMRPPRPLRRPPRLLLDPMPRRPSQIASRSCAASSSTRPVIGAPPPQRPAIGVPAQRPAIGAPPPHLRPPSDTWPPCRSPQRRRG